MGECPFPAVEGPELFAFGRAADNEGRFAVFAPADEVIIERVQRLADFEHHEVGYINHVADAAYADLFQHRPKPVRARTDLHAFQNARRVTRAKPGVVNPHHDRLFAVGFGLRIPEFRHPQRFARQRRYFPGDADDAVPIRTVRRDFEIIHHVPRCAVEIFRKRFAQRRIGWENQEAVHLVGQAQFLGRTHHALTGDAEHFSFLDDERFFLAGLQRQREVRQDQRHLVAGVVVLCAADDRSLAPAVIDLADRQLVRSGHFVFGEDLGDDDAFKLASDFPDAFDLEAEHGEPLGQDLGRPVEINVLFEPVKGDFHFKIKSL